MTRQEQGEAHNREAILRAQRAPLEEDLMHVVTLVETESAKWAERRSAVQSLSQQFDHAAGDDEARMAWYLAAYEDAQRAVTMTQSLMQRYNDIARTLTRCQRELMQLPRDHRRG